MMDDFKIDARRWRFLDNPKRYIGAGTSGLQLEPLTRQFKTAKEILSRLTDGRGVLLADDVGLGKTTIAALVAWVVASQGKRVRIYAPNDVLRRRWAEELERHVSPLRPTSASIDTRQIRQGNVERLKAGQIQVATHDRLIKSYDNGKQDTACDLMIVDEAHRAKGENSVFKDALFTLGNSAKRKLILTATPFSIKIAELEQLLHFVGAKNIDKVGEYAGVLKQLYSLQDGHDETAESKRLVTAARGAIEALQPYVIRHGIDDLSLAERKHFGAIGSAPWEIKTANASEEELKLLLRMDRLMKLAPERKGERRNDPRFHIGWEHVGFELDRMKSRVEAGLDPTALRHFEAARKSLRARRATAHPKIHAVSAAIRPLLEAGEKVLVFCHHRSTAGELLNALEQSLKLDRLARVGPPEPVWRTAWESLLPNDDPLIGSIIDWLCSPGLRSQIGSWLVTPARNTEALAEQIKTTRPRGAVSDKVPTIHQAAESLAKALLDEQSKSTRALLKNITRQQRTFGGNKSHFPGKLDDGFRVMGAWSHDGHGKPPETLYTGKPDIVLALFNSPFGPDVLVTTDRLSEGVDLHRCCRHLIHYELDPSPVRTLQRNGRVRRVGSWAALTGKPICYAYPTFGGTRDEKAVSVMKRRVNAFGLLLGGVPTLDDDASESEQSFADKILGKAGNEIKSLNRKLCI